MGGGGTSPAATARMNSRPDSPAAPAAVMAGSYQLTVLDRASPQPGGATSVCSAA